MNIQNINILKHFILLNEYYIAAPAPVFKIS